MTIKLLKSKKKGWGWWSRWYDTETRRFVVSPKRYYFCFVKGWRTGGKPGAWVETSVDLWCEFVIDGKDLDDLPGDREIVGLIEEWLAGHMHSWILNLRQVRDEWGVEREETTDAVTWPLGRVSAWRMPDYREKLISRELIDLA